MFYPCSTKIGISSEMATSVGVDVGAYSTTKAKVSKTTVAIVSTGRTDKSVGGVGARSGE